jgi:hypothetical protein
MDIKTAKVPPFAHMRRPSHGAQLLINKLGSVPALKSALKSPKPKPKRHVSWTSSHANAKSSQTSKAPSQIAPKSSTPLSGRSLSLTGGTRKPPPTAVQNKPRVDKSGDIFQAQKSAVPRIPPRPTHRRIKIRINPSHFRKLPDSVLHDIAWYLIHKNRSSALWKNEDKFVDLIMRQLMSFEVASLSPDASQSSDEPVAVLDAPRPDEHAKRQTDFLWT